jgi:hypothetical protein
MSTLPGLSPLGSVIAQTEGYGVPNAIPTVANNPGDLENGDVGYGTMTTANGGQVTIYPSLSSGVTALENQVSLMLNGGSSVYSPNMTVAQANSTYTGGATSTSWANSLGVDPNTLLGSLANKAQSIASGVQTAASVANGDSTGLPSWLANFSLEDGVMIVIGLLLIAAGIFSFKTAQSATINVVRTAAKAAKTSAEVAV